MLKPLVGWLALMLWVGCSGTQRETISQAFDVDAADAPTGGNCADVSQTVDLTTLDGFSELQGHLQKAEVVSAVLTVLNPNTDGTSLATQVSGDLSVGAPNTTPTLLATYDTLLLQTNQSEAATLAPGDPSAALTAAATTAPYQLNVEAHGCADQYPAHFQLQLDLTADLTVKLF